MGHVRCICGSGGFNFPLVGGGSNALCSQPPRLFRPYSGFGRAGFRVLAKGKRLPFAVETGKESPEFSSDRRDMSVQPVTIRELLNLAGRFQALEFAIREFHGSAGILSLLVFLVWRDTSENTSKKGGCTRTPANAYEHVNRIKVKPAKVL